MFIFFFTHYFFFKQPQRFLYKKSATLYQKHLQITYEIIDFEKFLYNISGVVAKHHKKHILYTDKSALCLAFCTLYPPLLFFFYQCFCFWYPKNKTPMKNIPWYTSHYYVAPQVYNLQQHLYIHTLQALQTSIAYSKKKTPQASKIVKSFKQTPYPRFSSFISRSAMILPQHVGHVFFVHNGKTYNTVSISPKMLGHKFGEFASTRKKPFHKKKK